MSSGIKLWGALQVRGAVFLCLLTQIDRNGCYLGLCFAPEEKLAAWWERNFNSEVRRKEDLGFPDGNGNGSTRQGTMGKSEVQESQKGSL